MTTLLFDGQRAFEHLRHLAGDIGPRLGGSPGEKRAADDIERYFRGLGLSTRPQPFTVRSYSPVESRLEVLDPALGSIPCEMRYMAEDTPPEGVTGEILFIDGNQPQSIGPEVRGKIVLVPAGMYGKAEDALVRAGPLAVIAIARQLGTLPTRTMQLPEVKRKLGAVPWVCISHEDGLRLIREGARTARIVARSREFDAESRNVIAELPGQVYPDEIVAVTGHYDSSLGIQGASDNAAGTAMVMELARVFSIRGSQRTLRFIAFGSEELGLRGSTHYIHQLEADDKARRQDPGFAAGRDRTELERHVLCINIDVHGAIVGANRCLALGMPDLAAAVRLLSRELGLSIDVGEDVPSTDSTPLSAGGIPSVSFSRSGAVNAHIHTSGDTLEHLSPAPLESKGRFIETFMQRYVAEARGFPFERKVPDELQKKIRQYFEEILRTEFFAG